MKKTPKTKNIKEKVMKTAKKAQKEVGILVEALIPNSAERLEDLLVMKVQMLYDTEHQLADALPVMAKHAHDKELKAGFNNHLKETKNHIVRLEKIFKLLGIKPERIKSEAIRGVVDDTEWLIKHVKKPNVLDTILIAAGQYAEHHEISGYGSAREWASLLDFDEIAGILNETLTEEKNADRALNDLALTKINSLALEVVM